jgi:hypothetical protein
MGEDGEYHCQPLCSLLPSLPQLCPSLSSLILDPELYPEFYEMVDEGQKGEISIHTSAALSAFRGLMHLQRLELSLPGLPEDALRNIISLDSLRYLLISNEPPHPFQSPMPGDRTNPCFPCLEHLEISTCSIDFCMWILANMRQTPLKVFSVNFEEYPSADDWTTLFLMMHDHLGHRHLQEIDIISPFEQGVVHIDLGLSMQQLAPLLSFTNLSQMRLEHVEIALDDDDMASIALAWPHLRTLHLPDQPFKSPGSVTFKGLASLARNCRVLTWLSLPSIGAAQMILNDFDFYNTVNTLRCSENLMLEALSVRREPSINNPALVAALLSALFPNLRSIYADAFQKDWSQVMCSIKRAVRE